MAKLTKAQVWEKIAIAYYKAPSKKNIKERGLVCGNGICDALGNFYYDDSYKIAKKILDRMVVVVMRDVKRFVGKENYDGLTYFCDPQIRKNDFLRGDYCMLQKYMEEYHG